MIALIVILTALLIILLIFLYFFCLAFLRKDNKALDDLDSDVNRFLEPYRDMIAEGMQYIENHPHKRVCTQSYDGLNLYASYYPKKESKRTIIIFHGYRSSPKRDYSCAVKMYGDMGLNVLLVDQRSHGESEGRLITFGVKERYDVLSWINFCLKEYGSDTEIFLGGMSMGASTVLFAAGLDLPKNVKGIIADCGFSSPVDIIKKVARKSFGINGFLAIPILDAFCRLIGRFSIYGISTADTLKNSDIPVIFIHGKSDDFVPFEMSKTGFNSAKGEKRFVLIEGAGHGLSFLLDPERVRKELWEFISAH